MDTIHITSKSSDADEKPAEQSISTPLPSKNEYDIKKGPIFLLLLYIHQSSLQKIQFQHNEMIISYRFYRTEISHSNLNSHLYICYQLTTPSNYLTKTKTSSLLLPRKK